MKKSAKMFALKTRREKEQRRERRKGRGRKGKQDKIQQRKFDYVRSHKIIARLSDCAMEDGKVYSCQIYKSSNDSIDTQWEPLVTFIKYIYEYKASDWATECGKRRQ